MFDFLLELAKLPWAGAAVILRVMGVTAVLFGTDYKFSDPSLKFSEENLYLVSRIEGGYTKKIRDLLLGATPIIIEYSISFNNRKTVLTKEISYDLFSKTFFVRNPDGQKNTNLKLSEAASQVENVVLPVTNRSELLPSGRNQLEVSVRAYPAKTATGISVTELWNDKLGLKMEFSLQQIK